jgi:hypothetical protein
VGNTIIDITMARVSRNEVESNSEKKISEPLFLLIIWEDSLLNLAYCANLNAECSSSLVNR